jgi:cytoskeleton protein RodZ
MRPQTASFVSALGEEFRSAREARSLSLSDVAERLHIRSVYLAAIEDEDWHVIGAPVYVRGFMRTYARFLGLDPEAAVARFSASVPAGTPAATAPTRTAATPAERRSSSAERASPSLAAVLSIVVAVLVVAFVGYEFYQYRSATPAPPLADASAAPGAIAAASAPADPGSAAPAGNGDQSSLAAIPPVASPVPRATPAAKRGLALNVTETSWLRVTVDGRVVLEGTLPSGAAKSFSGKVADVRVGNAGGVRIAVNGKPLGPLGASGDVVERRYVLTGE